MSFSSFHTNAPEVADNVNAVAGRVDNPAPGLEDMRQALATQSEQVWSSEGGAIGVHWPPAADLERKVDPRLLVATGALRASLSDVSAGQVVGNTRLEFGTDVPYGHFHQYGIPGRLPQRQFLGISEPLARELTDRLADFMVNP